MKKIIPVVAILFLTLNLQAQNKEVQNQKTDDNTVYKKVETMPEFPGGENGLFKFIQENVQYPEQAKKDSISGKVFVSFVVSKTGEVKDVAVLRGVRPDLDNEAIRVVKAMPKWKPGMDKGKAVNVQYNLPIKFNLGTEKK